MSEPTPLYELANELAIRPEILSVLDDLAERNRQIYHNPLPILEKVVGWAREVQRAMGSQIATTSFLDEEIRDER
jgi:hypothetical protein